MSHSNQKTSEILRSVIASAEAGGEITIQEFMSHLGDRAFCLAILIFSLPNSLPVPGIPGFSTITGLPITFIACQMLLGRETIWLPQRIGSKSFSRQGLAKLLSKALPTVIWLEKFLKPRWLVLTSPLGERLMGALIIVLSLIIALPIPGGNFLPGVSMSLLALAMLERDGLLLIGAIGFSVFSILFMYEVIAYVLQTVAKWISSLF